MIGYLEGTLRHKAPDTVIMEVHGVGYCVHVPLSTFYDLPGVGERACLNIHTHVREDALQLYGFRTIAEKEMFLHLIGIGGVGPRLALALLSGIHTDELREVVLTQNRARLQRIPGIGKKTAERILLELKDKLKLKASDAPAPPLMGAEGCDGYADAFSALLNLGYRPNEAEKALGRAKTALGADPSVEELLKEALRVLA
ncbi:MAG: Holliday junction branch migration protein RuvA [Thermodesulfobacteriota bacterium]|jgi:Holliday junction DNA helicase RuvA|nr:Holliday junction branch migration protein RuvA [Thermodesulfobacteriota bacterium]